MSDKRPKDDRIKYLAARLKLLMDKKRLSPYSMSGPRLSKGTIQNALKGEVPLRTYAALFTKLGENWENELKQAEDDQPTAPTPTSIDRFILDPSDIVDSRTDNFVGRSHVFRKVDEFLGRHRRGPGNYFVVKGDPGIGKSAVAVNLPTRSEQYPHLPNSYVKHFNNRASGPRSTREFLGNVSARVIQQFNLPYGGGDVPTEGPEGAAFLRRVLGEVGGSRAAGELVVVVDALDETDDVNGGISIGEGRNILGLPEMLPEGVNFVLTSRREDYLLRCERPVEGFEMEATGQDNDNDLLQYIDLMMTRGPRVARFAESCGLSPPAFAEEMLKRSEGNFLFLRHVLSDLSDSADHFRLGDVPRGLPGYYQQHWARMKSNDLDAWVQRRLPVIAAFIAEKAPMTVEHLADLTGISSRALPAILSEWKQFVPWSKKIDQDGRPFVEYRIYHTGFLDFLHEQPEIRDTGLVDDMLERLDRKLFD